MYNDITRILREGEYDQITEDMRRMRKRFVRPVLRDIAAWLMLHWLRHAARAEAADLAARAGNVSWGAGVKEDANKYLNVIAELFGQVHDNWTVKDWHDAQNMVDGIIAARDHNGKPTHVLGGILTTFERMSNADTGTGTGADIPVNTGSPPGDGRDSDSE